LQTQLLYWIRL